MIHVVRTPEANFRDLAGFPFSPHYFEWKGAPGVESLRMHYVDEGDTSLPVALCLHGMPTWSYLYRHMIPLLVALGFRVIAPDHIGFGRSDKVTEDEWYSIARHQAAMRDLIEHLDLKDITLICQDWGGPIGLHQVVEMPERFTRLVILNTWLHHKTFAVTKALKSWNSYWQPGGIFFGTDYIGEFVLASTEKFNMGAALKGETVTLGPQEKRILEGYNAPFAGLGQDARAGTRRFPLSLPFYNPEGGNAAVQEYDFKKLDAWEKPVHFIWGGKDKVFTQDWGREWAGHFPQASFDLLADAAHYPQDNFGPDIVAILKRRMEEE